MGRDSLGKVRKPDDNRAKTSDRFLGDIGVYIRHVFTELVDNVLDVVL